MANVLEAFANTCNEIDARKAKEQEEINFVINRMKEKAEYIINELSPMKVLGFSFKYAESDSYGDRTKPRVIVYYDGRYFCFLEPWIGTKEKNYENTSADWSGNDLYRYLHPCMSGTCESFARICARILKGE